MTRCKLKIINRLGLHARAATKFVQLASKFISNIELVRNEQKINGKSIMGVMMLAASRGTELTLIVDGEDEDEAVSQLQALIENRFGEDE